MKIAFFSDNFYPELSGISDSIIMTGRELAKRGHIVRFYGPNQPKKNFNYLNLPSAEPDLGQNVDIKRIFSLPFPSPTNQGRMAIPNILALASVKKFNPDIIHVHQIFGVGLQGIISAKLFKKVLIGTDHTPITEFIPPSLMKIGWIKKILSKYNIWFQNQPEFVSSPTIEIFKDMIKDGFYRPHRVISNPVSSGAFSIVQSKEQLKNKFGLNGLTLIYSGRLAIEKRITVILEALKEVREKIPQVQLLIVGKGAHEQKLKDYAEKLDLGKNVIFTGFVTGETLVELYRAADIFVIMSTNETQCLAAMKAMENGLPVIAARAWGLREYITPQNGILIEPENVEALAEKILYLYENPNVAEGLGKGGIEFVKSFTPEKIADIWENIYDQALANRYN